MLLSAFATHQHSKLLKLLRRLLARSQNSPRHSPRSALSVARGASPFFIVFNFIVYYFLLAAAVLQRCLPLLIWCLKGRFYGSILRLSVTRPSSGFHAIVGPCFYTSSAASAAAATKNGATADCIRRFPPIFPWKRLRLGRALAAFACCCHFRAKLERLGRLAVARPFSPSPLAPSSLATTDDLGCSCPPQPR